MIKKIILSVLSFFTFLALATPVSAQCPVCTVTVGGAVLLSRYLGVDDLIVGIWAGGLLISSGLWTATFIKKTYIKWQKWILTTILWFTTIIGLEKMGFIGNPTCKIHGNDKLLSGILAGTVAFLLAYNLDLLLRRLNKVNPGKAFFPYQRVILPVGFLIITTFIGLKICQLDTLF